MFAFCHLLLGGSDSTNFSTCLTNLNWIITILSYSSYTLSMSVVFLSQAERASYNLKFIFNQTITGNGYCSQLREMTIILLDVNILGNR